ncbi:MYG1 exonuclease [Neocloeon triangulifer]|uniref:MYG1 exonuclease n=1 Tax=Neocloeon triangulifer TaxID=2078957 RepID=UPI00286FA1F5|nr:MYG1 exonuclease [Neocloeon triangulifer]
MSVVPKKIGTHNGVFHCDEVVACNLLKRLPEYKDAEIVRTRDPKVLETCDIVVDVGAIYDHEKKRYDHHQREFNETLKSIRPDKPFEIKLSSAGLVFCHYGEQILRGMIGKENESLLDILYNKMYETFVMEIDGIDNGVNICDGEQRYQIHTNLSSRVGHLNPSWNETDFDENALFRAAMAMVGAEFDERVRYYSTAWWPARSIVQEAINKCLNSSDPKLKQIAIFDQCCPWKDHFYSIEEEMQIEDKIKFVIFESSDKQTWRVQGIPKGNARSFVLRLPLHEKWRGVRDEDLSSISGIEGCVFVHASGFIGGNKTLEGAIEMAWQTIEKSKTD